MLLTSSRGKQGAGTDEIVARTSCRSIWVTFRRDIIHHASTSAYHVLSADAYTKHGENPHGITFDELHAQPNRDFWNVLVTATGARRQPLIVAITTAGYDRNSICWEQHDYRSTQGCRSISTSDERLESRS